MAEPTFKTKTVLIIGAYIATTVVFIYGSAIASNTYTDKKMEEHVIYVEKITVEKEKNVQENFNSLKSDVRDIKSVQKTQGEMMVRIETLLKQKL